jgi:hypothetical protein
MVRTSASSKLKHVIQTVERPYILRDTDEKRVGEPENHFVVFVWLGSPTINESPRYWIATKCAVGQLCAAHPAHGTSNWERRFLIKDLDPEWENDWSLFAPYLAAPIEP